MSWTTQEDQILKELVRELGTENWELIAQQMFSRQCSFIPKTEKVCRLRWLQVLKPRYRKEKWTESEEKLLFEVHEELGNKWKQISLKFPGRQQNSIKNQFYTTLRKKLRATYKVISGKRGLSTMKINEIRPSTISSLFDKVRGEKFGNFSVHQIFQWVGNKKSYSASEVNCLNQFFARVTFFSQSEQQKKPEQVQKIERSPLLTRSREEGNKRKPTPQFQTLVNGEYDGTSEENNSIQRNEGGNSSKTQSSSPFQIYEQLSIRSEYTPLCNISEEEILSGKSGEQFEAMLFSNLTQYGSEKTISDERDFEPILKEYDEDEKIPRAKKYEVMGQWLEEDSNAHYFFL